MCDPMSIIGVGASLAGSMVNANQQARQAAMQQQAANQAAAASRNARLAEVERQARFEREQAASVDRNMTDLSPRNRVENQDTAANRYVQQYDTAQGGPAEGQYLSGQGEASPEVRQSAAASISQGAGQARTRAQAMAALSAYGTAEQRANNYISNTNNELATVSGLRRGSLSTNQFEQAVPVPTVSQGSSAMGDILSGIGGLAARAGGRAAGQAGTGINISTMFQPAAATTVTPTLTLPGSLY